MSSEVIDEPVRALVARHIVSLEQLEVLLWMRAHPETDWSANHVSDELRTNVTSAERCLRDLARREFLEPGNEPGTWKWSPATDELDRATRGLERAYAERRYTVIDLVFAKPTEQLRQFADAFRMRSDDDG